MKKVEFNIAAPSNYFLLFIDIFNHQTIYTFKKQKQI
jgi:hypothetical protein